MSGQAPSAGAARPRPGGNLPERLAAFARALRRRGVPVALTDEIDAARALALLDLLDRHEVRCGLLAALKIAPRHRGAFDALFERLWGGTGDTEAPAAPRARPRPSPLGRRGPRSPGPGALREAPATASQDVGGAEGSAPGYTPDELLRRKPFDRCTERDLAAMERLLRRLPPRVLAARPSRRLAPSAGRGRVDLRRSLRRAVATDGDLLRLARRAPRLERPALVLLCDTSGSMDPHARFLLAFALALRGAVRRLEVFAFNTSLTRITPWLGRERGIPWTLDRLAAAVPDWSGGTRIGSCLGEFVARHMDAVVDRRTVVVVLSDGLDLGDPDDLARAMRALRARARKVIWLNPLLGDERYRPEARGMRAALPFVDTFAPAHDLLSLERAFARAGT